MSGQSVIQSLLVCLVTLQWGTMATPNIRALNELFVKKISPASVENILSFSGSQVNSSCFGATDNLNNIESCLGNQCLDAEAIGDLYGLSPADTLDVQTLEQVAPALLYALIKADDTCNMTISDNSTTDQKPSIMGAWGYGFLFVTLINLCSLTGVFVLPFMKTKGYNVILMFLVALAVGTLVGSGVLVLIPEAFELAHIGGGGEGEGHDENSYLRISSSIIGGIYLFFLIERAMRIINITRENTKEKRRQDEWATRGTMTSSFTRHTPPVANQDMKNPATIQLADSPSAQCLCSMGNQPPSAQPSPAGKRSADYGDRGDIGGSQGKTGGQGNGEGENCSTNGGAAAVDVEVGDTNGTSVALIKDNPKKGLMNGHGHRHRHGHSLQGAAEGKGEGQVAPVAYMVIFGDGLHNFIDGLSIGAAFTTSVMLGISVSVAVICEELPHELGDFAILLNAGMRLRRALMYNFLSSLMCYAGLVLGILVGENTTAHTWIFGVAGGMFLYISLVDMMPEMNSASESKEGLQFGLLKTFLLQNLGLVCGYCIILLMCMYGGNINFEG